MLIFAPLLIAATGFSQVMPAAPAAIPAPQPFVIPSPVVAPGGAESGDLNTIVKALSGKTVTLEMRGSRVDVLARLEPRDGCSATLFASNLSGGPEWTRELRWDEIAWQGAGEDGRMKVAFYDPEGRLPIDIMRAPADDGATVAAAMKRLSSRCQARHPLNQTVSFGPQAPDRPCYFPRQPALVLADYGGSNPRQAMLTLVAKDRSLAELQLQFDLDGASGGTSRGARDRSGLVLYYGSHELATAPVSSLKLTVDGVAVPIRHSTAVFNAIRLRSRLFAASTAETGLLDTIGKAREVTITLLGPRGEVRRTLTFNPGDAVETARAAVAASGGSCAPTVAANAQPITWSPAK